VIPRKGKIVVIEWALFRVPEREKTPKKEENGRKRK